MTIDQGLTKIVKIAVEWQGGNAEVISISINTEFTVVEPNPQFLSTLLTMLQSGKISFNTWFFNLNKFGMYPVGTTQEIEEALIEVDPGIDSDPEI